LRPWLGTGSATYLYYGRQFRTERMQLDPVFTHNDYLQLLAEYGLAGAAIFLAFLASHVRAGWKNFRRLGPKRIALSSQVLSNALALNVGALVAVAALTVHSFFDFNMHIPANALLMAFVLGFLANSGVYRQTESNGPAWRSSTIFSSAALGITLIIQSWRLLPGEYFTERARAALRDYDAPTTIIYARKGLEHEASNPDLYIYLGRARMQLAEAMRDPVARDSFYKLAIPAFEQALALAPMDERIVLELAFTYDGLRRCNEAEELYQRALTMDPRSVSLHKYYEGHADCWQPKPIEQPSNQK
jgi:tetratricopeptide (TPR) repeat protein